jgi:hypothetical protein
MLRWLLLLVGYCFQRTRIPRHSVSHALAGVVKKKMNAEQADLLAEVGASTYAVEGDEASWSAALQSAGTVPSMISVKASIGKSKRQLEQESFAACEFVYVNMWF